VDNDFAGIRMWFNEFYARDTSRKIRAVNKAKGERGEHLTTNPPFGYIKDPENPKQWIIDEEAAKVVDRIDAERDTFVKTVAGTSRYDAHNYDFVINVTGMSTDAVASFLAQNISHKLSL
jgi:DNA invertase Pin-like site-specific DNA recombinase